MRRRRRCWTPWSRACRPRGCCSWSTTGPSTSTAGAARPPIRNCGSSHCHRAAPTHCSQALLGDDASLAPLTRLLIARTAGQSLLPGGERADAGGDAGLLVGAAVGAYRLARCSARAFRCQSHSAGECWQRVSTGLPLGGETVSCRQAAAGHRPRRCPCPCCRAIAELPEEALHRGLAHLQAAEFLYETRLFPERELHLQACPDARGGLWQPAPGAAAGAARPHCRGP